MYDVTSEGSFKNLRDWMTSIKDSLIDNCVITVLGNKIDLIDKVHYAVKYNMGARLAEVIF